MQKQIDFIHAILQNFDLDSKEESSDKDEETQERKPDSAWSRHILHPRSLILLLRCSCTCTDEFLRSWLSSHRPEQQLYLTPLNEINYDSVSVQLIDLIMESQCILTQIWYKLYSMQI